MAPIEFNLFSSNWT